MKDKQNARTFYERVKPNLRGTTSPTGHFGPCFARTKGFIVSHFFSRKSRVYRLNTFNDWFEKRFAGQPAQNYGCTNSESLYWI